MANNPDEKRLDEICQEIDRLFLEYLELHSAYYKRALSMAASVHHGHLQLAQAKYIMGPQRLSSTQYDKRMQSTIYL